MSGKDDVSSRGPVPATTRVTTPTRRSSRSSGSPRQMTMSARCDSYAFHRRRKAARRKDAWLARRPSGSSCRRSDHAPRDRRLRPSVAGRAFHNCVIVSIRKAFPAMPRRVMHALWGLGMLSLYEVDRRRRRARERARLRDVFFRVTANVDPKRTCSISGGPARPPRPRARQAVLRREARDRRDPQASGGGRQTLARGDRHERRDPRSRHRRWTEYGLP